MRNLRRLMLTAALWSGLMMLLGLNLYYGTTLYYLFELIPEWQPPHFQALATLLVVYLLEPV